VVQQLSPEQFERMKYGAIHYVENAARYRAGLKKMA
jgi:hypothetical protein